MQAFPVLLLACSLAGCGPFDAASVRHDPAADEKPPRLQAVPAPVPPVPPAAAAQAAPLPAPSAPLVPESPDNAEKPGTGIVFSINECRDRCVAVELESLDDYPFAARYLEAMGRRVGVNLVFPLETVQGGGGGEVLLQFRVDRKGAVTISGTGGGSGRKVLDGAAVESVTRAAPFNPFPPAPYVQQLRIRAKFKYS
jgi:TonB family protein